MCAMQENRILSFPMYPYHKHKTEFTVILGVGYTQVGKDLILVAKPT